MDVWLIEPQPPAQGGSATVRTEWPVKSSAWITTVYYGWGTAPSYVENQVAASKAVFVNALGTALPAVLKKITLEISAAQSDPVTLTARKQFTADYSATLTIPAGETSATWEGSVPSVEDLIYILSTNPGGYIIASFTITVWQASA